MEARAEGTTVNRLDSIRDRFSFFVPQLIIVLLSLLAATLPSGCARLQLPAIDPNGSRIFLPLPTTTQLDLPRIQAPSGENGFLPAPAFAGPTMPPPCIDGSCNTPGGICNLFDKKHKLHGKIHEHFRSPSSAGAIQLTPMRIVAPVGGEVVLLAGICGPDGYLVKRQPLEWMLSPESVGQIIEVGDDDMSTFKKLVHHKAPKVEKLDVDFAKGRTSNKVALIDRGTPNINDDIQLREGETWLSLSSPSEGISRVTVLAPEADCWDKRRQTATIYWVDAQWQFPQPRIARSGDTIQLVTRVTKAENLVPATDWLVRYTILDSNIASFSPPTGSNIGLVRVNSDGQAIANIVATGSARGTTPIQIEVIRPAQPSDSLPELVLGAGSTMVTFSAPGLALQAYGPDVATVGEQLSYVASLGNPGDIDAENVKLYMEIPAGMTLVSAVPQPTTVTNSNLLWDQGLLAANRQLDVNVVLAAKQANTVAVRFAATGDPGLSAQNAVQTQIVDASVELRFAPAGGVAQAEVGERVTYEVDVENTGRQTLTDLTLVIESDPGMPELSQGTTKVEQTIAMLQPGERRSLGVDFSVQQEGQHTAKLTVKSGNNVLAQRSSNILGLTPRPKQPNVDIGISFPPTMTAGEEQIARISVSNPGDVKLTNLEVQIQLDPSMSVVAVDQNNKTLIRLSSDGRSVTWNAQDLLPRLPGDGGDTVRNLLLQVRANSPVAQGAIVARVSSAENVRDETTTNVRIIASNNPVDGSVLPPTNEPRTGSLKIELDSLGDPTIVNNPLRYALRVTNESNQADRNVVVQLKLPEGVRFEEVTRNGTPISTVPAVDANVRTLETIQFLRPGEFLDYIVRVVPLVPQQLIMETRAYSAAQPNPVQSSESTTVTPRQ